MSLIAKISSWCQINNVEKIKKNLEENNIPNHSLVLPLYLASKNGHIESVKCIIDYMADFSYNSCINKIIIAGACYSGNISLVTFLTEHGFELSDMALNKICKIKDNCLRGKMIEWIQTKINIDSYKTAIQNLLKMKDDHQCIHILKNIADEQVFIMLKNILKEAALNNCVVVFDWLINKFHDKIYEDIYTLVTCLNYFVVNNNIDKVVQMLKANQLLYNDLAIKFTLKSCYNSSNITIYKYIIDNYNLDISYCDYAYIKTVAKCGNFELFVQTVQNICADPALKSCLEHCFKLSCAHGHIDIAKYIYNLGVSNSHDIYNNVLQLTATKNRLDVLKWLLTIFINRINEQIYMNVIETILHKHKSVQCLDYLLLNSRFNICYKSLYLKAFKQNIHVAKHMYEKYIKLDCKYSFTSDDFNMKDGLEIRQLIFLSKYHPSVCTDLYNCYMNNKRSDKNLKKISKYLLRYPNLVFFKTDNTFFYLLNFSLSKLSDDPNIFKFDDVISYNYRSKNLHNLWYMCMQYRIDNNKILKTDLTDIFTRILESYKRSNNTFEHFIYQQYIFDDQVQLKSIEDIKEYTTENRILKFCEKNSIDIDYQKVFNIQMKLPNCNVKLIKNKVSVEYVSDQITENFWRVGVSNLLHIYKKFPTMEIKRIPHQYGIWEHNNVPKIKFLLKFFTHEQFYQVINTNTNIHNLKCIIENKKMRNYMYERILDDMYQDVHCIAINEFQRYHQVVDIICKKYSNPDYILGNQLRYEIPYNNIENLDKIYEKGGKLDKFEYNDIYDIIKTCIKRSQFESVKWMHEKCINLLHYSHDIILTLCKINLTHCYDFTFFLKNIGIENIDEMLIISYYINKNNIANILNFDTSLTEICEKYICTINAVDETEKYQLKNNNVFNDTTFIELIEKFDFTTTDFMFFKVVCLFTDFIKNKYVVGLDIIIKYYPSVIFYRENKRTYFRFNKTKSARKTQVIKQ